MSFERSLKAAFDLVPIVLDGNAYRIPKVKYTLPRRSMGARNITFHFCYLQVYTLPVVS